MLGRTNVTRLLASVALTIGMHSAPAGAQQTPLTPRALGQVMDEVIRAVIPPDSSLSRVPVRERGLYFDFARTLAAFGYRDGSVPASALTLESSVVPGTDSLLADCNQGGTKPCERLGNSAYAYVAPLTRSDSAMVVWLVVSWPDRGGAPFTGGVSQRAAVFLTGFAMEVYLRRDADGSWRFARLGRARVSD